MSSTGTEPDPDVLLIGAGPTGAVAAKRFVEAGMSVVVLEQGDWPDYSKARADNPDFELTMGTDRTGRVYSRSVCRAMAQIGPRDFHTHDLVSDARFVLVEFSAQAVHQMELLLGLC